VSARRRSRIAPLSGAAASRRDRCQDTGVAWDTPASPRCARAQPAGRVTRDPWLRVSRSPPPCAPRARDARPESGSTSSAPPQVVYRCGRRDTRCRRVVHEPVTAAPDHREDARRRRMAPLEEVREKPSSVGSSAHRSRARARGGHRRLSEGCTVQSSRPRSARPLESGVVAKGGVASWRNGRQRADDQRSHESPRRHACPAGAMRRA